MRNVYFTIRLRCWRARKKRQPLTQRPRNCMFGGHVKMLTSKCKGLLLPLLVECFLASASQLPVQESGRVLILECKLNQASVKS